MNFDSEKPFAAIWADALAALAWERELHAGATMPDDQMDRAAIEIESAMDTLTDVIMEQHPDYESWPVYPDAIAIEVNGYLAVLTTPPGDPLHERLTIVEPDRIKRIKLD
jgi:hypothetical protein